MTNEVGNAAGPLACNLLLSFVAFLIAKRLIPSMSSHFIRAKLFGRDLNKTSNDPVPEGLGVVCGTVYLVAMFSFIPFPFLFAWLQSGPHPFPHEQFVVFLSALLSICCMILLGFGDDVLDLPWRHRLILPTVASLPLLMAYLVTIQRTIIVVPLPLRFLLGNNIDLGLLYYIYMGMLAVFCTNSINILAGINGVECGQSVVIAASVIVFNTIELIFQEAGWFHLFSLYFLIPFLGVSLALLHHNWYPSAVFVGDTFCYFAGMTFAVVGILGHFGKTLLLFFLPQIVNFLYSVPQLFKIIPCPRHRLPKFHPESGLLHMSYSQFKSNDLSSIGHILLQVLSTFHLADVQKGKGEDGTEIRVSNLTLINFFIKIVGPIREDKLTKCMLAIQILGSAAALFIRYPLAWTFY